MKKAWILGAALLSGSFLAAPAHAALTMTITDSGGGVTVINETSPGEIVTSGVVGLFNFEIHTTASNAGSGLLAEMVSTTLNLTAEGADFFTISVTEDNFTNPSPNESGEAKFETAINASTSTGGANYDAESLVDGSSLLAVNNVGDLSSFTTSDMMTIGTPFSITHEWTVRSTGAGESLAFDMSTRAIPEPGVLGLLGLGLAGLAFSLRRRKDSVAA